MAPAPPERWPAPLSGPLYEWPKKQLAVFVARAMRAAEASGLPAPPGHVVLSLPKLSGALPRSEVEEHYLRYVHWYDALSDAQRTALGSGAAAAAAGADSDGEDEEEEERKSAEEQARSRWQHPQTCYQQLPGPAKAAAIADQLSYLNAQEVLARSGLARDWELQHRALLIGAQQAVQGAAALQRIREREEGRQKSVAAHRLSAVRLEDTELRRGEEQQRQRLMPLPPGGLRWEVRDHPELQAAVFAEQRGAICDEEAAWRSAVAAEEGALRQGLGHHERQASPQRARSRPEYPPGWPPPEPPLPWKP